MRMLDKKTWFCGVLTLLILAVWALPTMAQAQGTIAIVDMEKAVNETNAGKRAQAELRRKADKLQAEMKALGDDVQNLRKDLENTAALIKPEAKLAKEREFERKVRLLNDRKRDAEQEIREAQRDFFNPILQNLGKIINDIGTKGSYGMILEARTALYFPKSIDITSQVIAAYDKSHP